MFYNTSCSEGDFNMKKRNLILLSMVCILSLCLFTSLLVYAFQLQAKKDLRNSSTQQENLENTDELNPENQTPDDSTATPTPVAAPNSAVSDEVPTSSDSTDSAENTEANSLSSTSDDSENNPVATSEPDTSYNVVYAELPASSDTVSDTIVLGFAGDVNLDEDSYPAAKYDAEDKDINGCFSDEILEEMNTVDIMMLNNEFAYSIRGTEEQDKSYTFRADPSRVEILQKMGVDIVSLANNHALDFGPDALIDTFDTLDSSGIEYVGAGNNLDRAKAPIYYEVGDKTIAIVAASRVVFAMDWYASEDGLGMIGTYDPTLILESIREAEANSDFVVIYVHWGVERNNYPEDFQRTMATQYIDAGADAVIGCHPHVMQGLEFYKGKPIAYSLGNFWFNKSTKESGMIKLYLDSDDSVRIQLLPAMNKDTFTFLLTDVAEKKNYYNFIEELSYNASIDENGFITEVE